MPQQQETPKIMSPKPIYLDYASTTPVIPEVLEAMIPFFTEIFGNPSSSHKLGLEAKKAVDKSRSTIAQLLNCSPKEVVFTSGGTESNNLAIFGSTKFKQGKKQELLTSNIEHSSVKSPLETLQKEGVPVHWLNPEPSGILSINDIKKTLTPNTSFASFIYANNEIGTVQNIAEIAGLLHAHSIIFHTDACQAAGYEDIDTKKLGIDLMSINAGKIYGPKGIGILYVKSNTPIHPIIYGGGQEYNLRSGTCNVPAIVGMAKALEISTTTRKVESQRLKKLRDYAINELLAHLPKSKLNGHPNFRLANNISIMIPGINAREMILHLDTQGICISSGSACATGKEEPSHVLKALGLTNEEAKSTLRITLGKHTNHKDLEYAIKTIIQISRQLT